jgi:hypothetical protein
VRLPVTVGSTGGYFLYIQQLSFLIVKGQVIQLLATVFVPVQPGNQEKALAGHRVQSN